MIQKSSPALNLSIKTEKCLAKLMKAEPQQQQKKVTEISKHW